MAQPPDHPPQPPTAGPAAPSPAGPALPPAAPPPQIPAAESRAVRRRQLQLVWIIPLVAALIGGWILVQSLFNKGPTVTISFSSADGLEVGKTRIKYRDVDIGTVKHIGFDEKFETVLVTADLTKAATPLLLDDTRFWVVRPRVGAGGISGLGTLLSGAYIGLDVGKSQEARREFKGLEKPPTVTADLAGRRFYLRAETAGSLDIGSPVYYRRVQVGRVVSVELDTRGSGDIVVQIFVDSPYERFVTDKSRFWEASGVDITLDAAGFRVSTQSAASILAGGIAFQSAAGDTGAEPAKEGSSFRMATNQASAMKETETETLTARLYFAESLRGLSPGAPLDFRGVVIGEVRAVGVEYDPEKRNFRFPVLVQVFPARLWSRAQLTDRPTAQAGQQEKPEQVLKSLVERGFRAQLRPGNLLTGQLYVALDFFPKAPKAELTVVNNVPEIPTIGGSLGEFQASISDLLAKVNRIPFEGISDDLRKTLQSASSTLSETQKTVANLGKTVDKVGTELPPELMNTLGDLRQTMADVRRTVDSAGQSISQDSALQTELRDTLREVNRAANSLRQLTEFLERHPESLIRGKPGDIAP